MHNGMQYDPIQGQDSRSKSRALESWKSGYFQTLYSLFSAIYKRSWQL